MRFFFENMPEFLLVLGLLLLVIEVLVMGFTTFFLFFIGIGLISTALIFFSGAIAATSINALMSTAIISAISTLLLWKPLQKLQDTKDESVAKNDLIGMKIILPDNLKVGEQITYQYSGVYWKLTSSEELVKGDEVEVIAMSVGKMQVQSVASSER